MGDFFMCVAQYVIIMIVLAAIGFCRAAPWQPGHAVCRDTGPQTGDLLRPRPRPARGYYRDLRQGPRDNDRARRNQGTVCGTGDRGGVLGAVNFTLPSPLGGEGGPAGPDEGRACRRKP